MTFIWLSFWLLKDTPAVEFANWDLNNWAIALVICLVLDLFGGKSMS